MINRISEIRKCLEFELYEAALSLALTLPDICGQVQYPNVSANCSRYQGWIDNFMDINVLSNSLLENLKSDNNVSLDESIEPLSSKDIYKLRCSFLHSGNDDINSSKIDEFELCRPESMNKSRNGNIYGYKYGRRQDINGNVIHYAKLNVKYICDKLCEYAEKYYQNRKPEDFDCNKWELK